ncbi:Type 1 phosphatases regulator ypi1 [Coemansia guatemalensis]|uniref:Type 1 phosphatases regulator n=1 Tax=Coemansia guatemalensis TaxID=2761395 RepID=A0A9W8HWP3_9FUNG|nr:Type 1 phosphatases regulator ypi1 [Coemansia guatemalensis]
MDRRERTDASAVGRAGAALRAEQRERGSPASVASHGSHTVVVQATPLPPAPAGILHLRGDGGRAHSDAAPRASTQHAGHVRWEEDVVDNEGQGRKSSKVCCIYHRERAVGESDTESSCSSSGSDSDSPNEYERVPRYNARPRQPAHQQQQQAPQ